MRKKKALSIYFSRIFEIFTMFIIFIFIFLALCNCSPVTQNQAEPIILDKNTIEITQNKKILQGTGRALFNQPLFNLFSKELYFITAEMFNEKSSLVLHSHFTGFIQRDGIKVFFMRDKDRLTIQASSPNYPDQLLHTNEKYFIQNQVLKVYVLAHNGTKNFINIKIWTAHVNLTGYLKEPVSFLTRQNLITDSSDFIFHSRGKGMLWGVELNKIRLIKISREPLSQ